MEINAIINHRPASYLQHKVQRFCDKLIENVWLNFIVRKHIHNRNIRQARRIMKLLNKADFRNSAPRFFSYIRKIDPLVFEELLLYCFAMRGFKIKRNPRYTGDGGFDGHVKLNGSWWPVQAKRYHSHINPVHVADFSKTIARKGYSKGLFIHTGKTGGKSYKSMRSNESDILLVSGYRLHTFVTHCLG